MPKVAVHTIHPTGTAMHMVPTAEILHKSVESVRSQSRQLQLSQLTSRSLLRRRPKSLRTSEHCCYTLTHTLKHTHTSRTGGGTKPTLGKALSTNQLMAATEVGPERISGNGAGSRNTETHPPPTSRWDHRHYLRARLREKGAIDRSRKKSRHVLGCTTPRRWDCRKAAASADDDFGHY